MRERLHKGTPYDWVCVCVGVGAWVQLFVWQLESSREEDVNSLDQMLSRVTADVDQLPRLAYFPLGEPFSCAVLPSPYFMEKHLANKHSALTLWPLYPRGSDVNRILWSSSFGPSLCPSQFHFIHFNRHEKHLM